MQIKTILCTLHTYTSEALIFLLNGRKKQEKMWECGVTGTVNYYK